MPGMPRRPGRPRGPLVEALATPEGKARYVRDLFHETAPFGFGYPAVEPEHRPQARCTTGDAAALGASTTPGARP